MVVLTALMFDHDSSCLFVNCTWVALAPVFVIRRLPDIVLLLLVVKSTNKPNLMIKAYDTMPGTSSKRRVVCRICPVNAIFRRPDIVLLWKLYRSVLFGTWVLRVIKLSFSPIQVLKAIISGFSGGDYWGSGGYEKAKNLVVWFFNDGFKLNQSVVNDYIEMLVCYSW